jgi:hypothetical protein
LIFFIKRANRFYGGYLLDNFGFLLCGKQIWNLSIIQDIANLLNHTLFQYLSIWEQENCLSLLKPSDLHYSLHLLNPVLWVDFIVLRHIGDIRTKHCQRFPSATTDSNQKSMSECCRDDSINFNDMLNSDHEQYKIHFICRIQVVVLLQVRLTFFLYGVSIC